jgi:hypothetical protein
MIKKTLTIISLLLITKLSLGTVLNIPINKIVDATNSEYKLDITGDGAFDFTINYFASSGAISITPRVGNGNSFALATNSLGGGSYNPVKVKNNQLFTNQPTWKSTSIFLHNASLNYSDFAGKGNQYVVGKMNYDGNPTILYYWILVNVNAMGKQINIVKSSFENDSEIPILTGNEGESNTSILSNTILSNSLIVFPQPSSTEIEVKTNETIVTYKIYDLNGKTLNDEKFTSNKIISVANLPKGIYLLQLINQNNFILTKKIIIE